MLTKRNGWLQIRYLTSQRRRGRSKPRLDFSLSSRRDQLLIPPSCITERRTKFPAQLTHGAMEVWVRVQCVHVITTSEVTVRNKRLRFKGETRTLCAKIYDLIHDLETSTLVVSQAFRNGIPSSATCHMASYLPYLPCDACTQTFRTVLSLL